MKQTIAAAGILILLTAAIGIGLWLLGFPPEKAGLSERSQTARAIVTLPLFWAATSAVFTVPSIWFKRERLRALTGKALLVPMVGCLAFPIMFLLTQILLPLDFYQLIGADDLMLAFFFMIASFFLVMGNYLTTIPFESRVGFRSSATCSDPVIWTRAHRFLGRSLVLASLVSLPLPLIMDAQVAQWVLIGMAMLMKSLTWLYARRLQTRLSLRKLSH